MTSIGNSAFSGCTVLRSINIPDGVTSIGNYAFDHCTSLTSITIPDNVTGIGDRAFYQCTSLTSAAGYKVQQLNGKTWKTIKTITKNSTVTCKVTGLKAGTNYKFRVVSYKGKLDGAASAQVSAYTNPSKVTGLKASAKAKNTITLKWDKNTGGTGYEIQMMKNGKWVTVKTITKNSTVSYKVTGLKAKTTYKFRVRACRGKQYGAYSTTLTASTTK